MIVGWQMSLRYGVAEIEDRRRPITGPLLVNKQRLGKGFPEMNIIL